MKSILVHVDADDGLESRLQAALDLGRFTGGHLELVQVRRVPALYGADTMGFAGSATMVMQIMEEDGKVTAAERARLEARLAVEDVPFTFDEAMGPAGAVLVDRSLLADVVVMSLADRGRRDLAAVLAETVTRGDAPVLAVPQGWPRLETEKPALVAWKATREAAAAVKAALPLLQRAGRADVVTIDPPGEGDVPPTAVARYLSRHGVAVELHQRRADDAATADVLLATASELSSGLLVMGGYGRSRAMEFLLGGVTRRLLSHATLPLLMAH
jgi:nucleotide-binding universal stress UspA family protein